MKRFAMLFVAAMSMPIAAHADTMPASVLYESCTRTDEASVAVCSAYFMGVLDALAISGGTTICAADVTPMNLRDRFVTTMKALKPAASAQARGIVQAMLLSGNSCSDPAPH